MLSSGCTSLHSRQQGERVFFSPCPPALVVCRLFTDGRETMETVRGFALGGSKITADGDWSHEIIKDPNVRPETIKLLEENIGKKLSDIHHSRILYDPPPRILEIKAKINGT